jgi:hypothetical protein
MSICGSSCSITGALSNVDAHAYTIDLSSQEFDVRVLGDSNEYGTWVSCVKQGTITVNSYARPDYDPGDSVIFASNCGSEAISIPCVVIGQTIGPVDSQSIVEFTTNMRISGSVTIT